jgi:hypothetical protein
LVEATKRFVTKSGVDFFNPKLIENEVIPLLKSGDITSLGERMGMHMAQETQWIYRRGNSPVWARGLVGRVIGQYGTWPSWFVEYGKNLATRGSGINRVKRLAGLAAIQVAASEVGDKVFGVNLNSWLYTSPFQWFPIPVTAWNAARKVAYGSDLEQSRGLEDVVNLAGMHAPGFIYMTDVAKGLQEDRNEDQVKRFLGFKPTVEE